MTTLFLARHGETIWHEGNRYAGSSDIPLTERGVEQSEALARWAVANGITHLFSSGLARAVQTANPTAQALAIHVRHDDRLREVDFGAAEGLTTAEMRGQFPDALREFHKRPATSPLPRAEPGAAALKRAWPALTEIAASLEPVSGASAPASKALIVMHSTLMRLILCKTLEIPLDNYRRAFPSVFNVAITSIRFRPVTKMPEASLLSYNIPVYEG